MNASVPVRCWSEGHEEIYQSMLTYDPESAQRYRACVLEGYPPPGSLRKACSISLSALTQAVEAILGDGHRKMLVALPHNLRINRLLEDCAARKLKLSRGEFYLYGACRHRYLTDTQYNQLRNLQGRSLYEGAVRPVEIVNLPALVEVMESVMGRHHRKALMALPRELRIDRLLEDCAAQGLKLLCGEVYTYTAIQRGTNEQIDRILRMQGRRLYQIQIEKEKGG